MYRRALKHTGSASLLAIGTMVITLLAVLLVCTTAIESRVSSRRELDAIKLKTLADAGIQYGYWQRIWQNAALPYQVNNFAVGDGTVNVTVTDNASEVPNSIKIVSVANYRGKAFTSTRVVSIGLDTSAGIYSYAFVSGSEVTTNKLKTGNSSSNTNGDMRINGDLKLHGQAAAYGNAYASGTITGEVGGTLYNGYAAVAFPSYDHTRYRDIAFTTATGNQTWGAGTINFNIRNMIYYINGSLTLNGTQTISGRGTLVVRGNVTINGNVQYANTDSRLVVLTENNLVIGSSVTGVVGIYYVHNVASSNSSITLNNDVNNSAGSFIADSYVFNVSSGYAKVVHNPIDSLLCRDMKMPGYW